MNSKKYSRYNNPHFIDDRRVIVHLMEWKYKDIGDECERFLGPNGYGGVQVSPVNEHAILDRRPWYERYQPVSYVIKTRSGDEQQFSRMVKRCNDAGVRIYVDVVLNHMTGGQEGYGTAGNYYNGHKQLYPGVPYYPEHFNGPESCTSENLEIDDWDDPKQLRNCRLFGLRDLKQSCEYVREKQIEFLNKLIDFGVAGFRFDASTHMWPQDLHNIISRLNNLNEKYFPPNSRPFIYHEIIYYGGGGINPIEYKSLGRVIEFRFWKEITNIFRTNSQMKWLKNFGIEWGLLDDSDAFIMIDNHDLRVGHNGQLGFNINCFEPQLLEAATAFMLAWNYGIPCLLSSYRWKQIIVDGKDLNEWMGPPVDLFGNIISVKINSDNTWNDEYWMCEHRWKSIKNMVKFKAIVGDEPIMNWWDNDDYQIAFSRGNRGFIAFNLQKFKKSSNDNLTKSELDLCQKLQTGLPEGIYSDIISGNCIDDKYAEKTIIVDHEGYAEINIDHNDSHLFIATHIGAKIL